MPPAMADTSGSLVLQEAYQESTKAVKETEARIAALQKSTVYKSGFSKFVAWTCDRLLIEVTNPVLKILTQKRSIRFRDFNDFRDFQDFKDIKDFQDLWVKSECFCITL